MNDDKKAQVPVYCEVAKCIYNDEERYCTAEHIHVGPHFAATTNDTACETFEEESNV